MNRAHVLALALLASGCILQPTETPDCAGSSCGECLSSTGCGWCGSTSRCVPGSSFGPDEAECLPSSWRFTSCASAPGAVDDCARHDDCNGCLFALGDDTSGCAWCPATDECIREGDSCGSGPRETDYDRCTEADCEAQTSCGDCVAEDVVCSWCDVGGGVCTTSLDCDPHYNFSGVRGSCPPPNRCSQHFGCEACLADPGCGFCDAPGGSTFCVAVSGSSDYADWCTLDLYTSGCPP